MKQGFIKVAAATPKISVADCVENTQSILESIREMREAGAKIMVLPELAVTGYTCSDLFWQERLIRESERQLSFLLDRTRGVDALIFVGMPMEVFGKLYNVAAVMNRGNLLGIVPKKHIPSYHEFYEGRHFTPGEEQVVWIEKNGERVPFGMNLLFSCREMPKLVVAAEICEDLWVPNPPSVNHALAGATVLVNLSASDEMTGKDLYRRELVQSQSARTVAGYIYADAGVQIIIYQPKHLQQLLRFQDIIQRVAAAHRRPDGSVQFKLPHILLDIQDIASRCKLFFLGFLQHVRGAVHTDHIISAGRQQFRHLPRAASQIQH